MYFEKGGRSGEVIARAGPTVLFWVRLHKTTVRVRKIRLFRKYRFRERQICKTNAEELG